MPQQQSNITRDYSIDIARGIAILGVLYGHAMAWQDIHESALTHWFWSFHMALFALVSGYYYKDKTIGMTFVNSVKNLLVPLWECSLILFVINKIGGGDWKLLFHDFITFVYSTITFQVSPPGFWFVIALFNCKIILAIISKINIKYKYLVLAALSIFIFFFPKHIGLFHFTHTFGLMVFVIIGIYAKRYALLDMRVNKYCAVILAIILISAGLFFIDIWRYYMPLYVLNFATASIISYALIFYCKQLEQLNTKMVNPIRNLFAFCGRHSMMILSFQAILGIRVIEFTKQFSHIENAEIIMLIFVFCCLGFTFILNGIRTIYNILINKTTRRLRNL